MDNKDFKYIIIGGTTKSGTTSVFTYLTHHPQVCGSRIKESRFFWNNAYPLPDTGVSYKNNIQQYYDLFDCQKAATHRVEATPDYMYDAACAKLIRENLTDVLMVFVLRHPVSRLESWYRFAKQLNLIDATVSMEDYVKMQWEIDNDAPQHLRALEQGRYAKYLQPYVDTFGNKNILLLQYEDLAQNPGKLMQKICDRAGLDFSFYRDYDFKVLNKSINVKNPESFNRYRNFRRGLRKFLKSLPGFIGNPLKATIKPLDKAYIHMTSSEWEAINMDSKLFEQLQEYYTRDEAALQLIDLSLNTKV